MKNISSLNNIEPNHFIDIVSWNCKYHDEHIRKFYHYFSFCTIHFQNTDLYLTNYFDVRYFTSQKIEIHVLTKFQYHKESN